MLLKKAILDFPSDVWLEVSEQLSDDYTVYVGRAPLTMITGAVLNYEVLKIGKYYESRGLKFQRVLVRWRKSKKNKKEQ